MKKISILIFLSVIIYNLKGQTTLINATNNGQTLTGCSRKICDSGDTTGNYGNSQNYTVSFTSNNPLQPGVSLEFLQDINIEPNDTLWIYDGDGTSPSQLFSGGPTNRTFFNDSNKLIAGSVFQMSAINTSHKITIKFKSNAAVVGNGFKIQLSCNRICQTVISRINNTLTDPQPDTNYIAICPWDTVKFVAQGYYPMSDTMTNPLYHQRDGTSTFVWDFGDGTSQTVVGSPIANHFFTSGRGYDIQLTILDSAGCQSNNSIGLRVMTSQNPISSIDPLADICSGSSLNLNVGYSQNSTIHISPIVSAQSSSQTFDSTTFIPDGMCNGTNCYNTFVTFNNFTPNQTITNVNDILSVCLNMEHTFVGDIHFEIVCPNGQSTDLMTTTGSLQHGGANLGIPNTTDNSSNKCDPGTNPPGTGWTYCWSEIASYTYHGSLDDNSDNTVVDSTNRANHTNFLTPQQPFSNLIGCPLNGTWNIQVCDLWGIDNGYVFWWSLELDPSLVPQAWTYDVGINNVLWSGPYISSTNDTTAAISPAIDANGLYDYTFSIIDNFGCAYDSLIKLNVVQTPTPNLGSDTSFCNDGTILILNPHYGITNTSFRWSDATNDPTTAVMEPGTYMITVTNKNADQSLSCYGYDTINVQYFPMPTANFSALPTEGCSPLLVQFTDESTPTGINYTYAWDFGDPSAQINTSAVKNPQHIYSQYGNFDVSLLITSPDGCSAVITKPGLITVHPTPIAKFTANPANTTLSENPTITFTNQSENFILSETTWLWNFLDGNTSTEMNATNTYTAPKDYNVSLIARNTYGCTDTAYFMVIVEDELFIPNILTPNGDNNNDFLVIGNLNTNRANVLKIFDRWGKKVYEKKNYNTTSLCKKQDAEGNSWLCEEITNADQGWDGEGCSDGVYFYTFFYEGVTKTVEKNGTITILGNK